MPTRSICKSSRLSLLQPHGKINSLPCCWTWSTIRVWSNGNAETQKKLDQTPSMAFSYNIDLHNCSRNCKRKTSPRHKWVSQRNCDVIKSGRKGGGAGSDGGWGNYWGRVIGSYHFSSFPGHYLFLFLLFPDCEYKVLKWKTTSSSPFTLYASQR